MKKDIITCIILCLSFCCHAQLATPCAAPATDKHFQLLKESIKETDHDDTRLEAAKDLIASNCFTSAQVLGLCKLFLMDASRLKIAEWAYPRTVDPGNYAKVNIAFESETFTKELNTFINNATQAH